MPTSLVRDLGQRSRLSEYKAVLSDARDQIMRPLDAEKMARELVESGDRDYVDMVRELSTELANTKRELEDANRRYERLIADLARRGISLDDFVPPSADAPLAASEPVAAADGLAEWEEWNRRFQALLG